MVKGARGLVSPSSALGISRHHVGACKTFAQAQWPEGGIRKRTDFSAQAPSQTFLYSRPRAGTRPWTTWHQKGDQLAPEDAPGTPDWECLEPQVVYGLPSLQGMECEAGHPTGTSCSCCRKPSQWAHPPWGKRNLLSGLTCIWNGARPTSSASSVHRLVSKTLCTAVRDLRNWF